MQEASNNAASWISSRAQGDASGALAIVDADRRLDYATLDDRIGRLAAWLRDTGVRAGDRVALLLANRSATLEGLFAAARIGAIALPVNTRLAPGEIAFLFDDCQPRVLLCEAGLADLAQRAAAASSSAPGTRLGVGSSDAGPDDEYEQALAGAGPSPDVLPVSPEAPMILMYTSGTTGRPKGALLPHRKALFNAKNAVRYFGIERDDRVLVVAPLFHSLGLQILALPALYAGATVWLREGFDAAAVWQAVQDERITYMGGVPTMYQRLLDELDAEPGRPDTGSLRFLFTAGAPAPAELVRAYHERGLALLQGYGQTESSTLTCLSPEDALRKAGSVGLPVHHVELRVVRSESIDAPVDGWKDAAPGEPGEIVVRGPIVMLGYWERPEATAETVREGWLRTGDLATRDAEGFVTLIGRSREMYISGGENVYPAEVEVCFLDHPAVREIAVQGVPDERWGETGVAHVVLEEGAVTDGEALSAWGSERLAKFKLPRRFVFVPELPRTASGKIKKHELATRAHLMNPDRAR